MVWAILGCTVEPEETLALEGPAEVRVEYLGVVEGGPVAVLSNGGVPEGLEWTIAPDGVARIGAAGVEAVAPGQATITGRWQEQTVQWFLRVDPPVLLLVSDAPASVHVGQTVRLSVGGRIESLSIDPGALTYRSSDPRVAATDPEGGITGVTPGVAYITVSASRGDAMVELHVVP